MYITLFFIGLFKTKSNIALQMEGTIDAAVIARYVNPQNSSDAHTESLNSILLGIYLIPSQI